MIRCPECDSGILNEEKEVEKDAKLYRCSDEKCRRRIRVFNEEDEDIAYLNENINNIERFEVLSDFYMIIHMKDASQVVLKPEYGGIYLKHRSKK